MNKSIPTSHLLYFLAFHVVCEVFYLYALCEYLEKKTQSSNYKTGCRSGQIQPLTHVAGRGRLRRDAASFDEQVTFEWPRACFEGHTCHLKVRDTLL